MITKNGEHKGQIQMLSLDQLVPEDHLLRKIDEHVDFSFIYKLVEDKYSPDNGRPSLDPVTLIKIPVIQYMFGIKSMRQTIKEIEVNVAYRWFLGLDFFDDVPHFTTFGKNYKRRFEGTDLFEQIFIEILMQCMKAELVDPSTLFVDATHVKAAANRKKAKKILIARNATKFYEQKLEEEINTDREEHGKKPLDFSDEEEDDDRNNGNGGGSGEEDTKEIKVSTTDPESGWFHKGEHKEVFAYSVEAACDRYGWVVGYTVHPGNEHDSTTFPAIYEKIKKFTKPGDLIRHNVAGDMANARGELDLFLVAKLANAFLNRKAYTYTHCPINRDSAAAINNVRECTGFLINASCETVAEVLNAHAHSVPAVLAVKSRAELPADTDTEKYVLCPAQSGYKTCKTCRLCQKERLNKAGRRVVICFEAHGANARQAGMVLDSKNKVIPIHTH